MEIPKYVTGLSRRDLEEIRDATNLMMGPGIDLEHANGGWRISINQNQLKRWMRAFYQNGGMSCAVGDIDSISLDLQ